MYTDEQWLSVVEAFSTAALEGRGWMEALSGMAALTGSRVGELVGFGSDTAVRFNFMSNFDPAAVAEFAELGGGNPDYNPRLRAGINAPLMQSIAEADFVTRDEFQNAPYYADYCRRHDLPFSCVMSMIRDGDSMIGLGVFRSSRQGHITTDERRLFESIAPHVRAAVRVQALLENQGALVLKGALEALSLAVFVCDGHGQVRAMTHAAEEFIRDGNVLRVRQGYLRAPVVHENQRLAEHIALAASPPSRPLAPPTASSLLLAGGNLHPTVLDIVPLPRQEHAFGFEPRVLVVVRSNRQDGVRTLALLQAAYRLTPAEAQVALQLAEGQSPQLIAQSRGVSVSTVRVQIRTIFVKLGVRRQSELVARLSHLR